MTTPAFEELVRIPADGVRIEGMLELNRDAYARLTCTKELTVVPGATHLFEEPGTLEQVADRAGAWFVEHLPVSST